MTENIIVKVHCGYCDTRFVCNGKCLMQYVENTVLANTRPIFRRCICNKCLSEMLHTKLHDVNVYTKDISCMLTCDLISEENKETLRKIHVIFKLSK